MFANYILQKLLTIEKEKKKQEVKQVKDQSVPRKRKAKTLKHMKKYSTSLVIREMQITATLKYRVLFIILVKIQD